MVQLMDGTLKKTKHLVVPVFCNKSFEKIYISWRALYIRPSIEYARPKWVRYIFIDSAEEKKYWNESRVKRTRRRFTIVKRIGFVRRTRRSHDRRNGTRVRCVARQTGTKEPREWRGKKSRSSPDTRRRSFVMFSEFLISKHNSCSFVIVRLER